MNGLPITIVFLAFYFLSTLLSRAVLPIPDLILFGTVYHKTTGAKITNPSTIEVTVKLNSGTTVVAQVSELVHSSTPLIRDFYVLRIPREDGATRTIPENSISGDVLHLYLNGEEVIETAGSNVSVSGNPVDVRRLDLNSQNNLTIDSDRDGLPDEWELSYFPSISSQTGDGDSNSDGITNFAAYAMGLDPRQSEGAKLPKLEKDGANFVFYFRKSKNASGLDYFVQKSPNLSLPAWQVVLGTMTFVGSDADSDLYKMTIPGGIEGAGMFFRLLAIKG